MKLKSLWELKKKKSIFKLKVWCTATGVFVWAQTHLVNQVKHVSLTDYCSAGLSLRIMNVFKQTVAFLRVTYFTDSQSQQRYSTSETNWGRGLSGSACHCFASRLGHIKGGAPPLPRCLTFPWELPTNESRPAGGREEAEIPSTARVRRDDILQPLLQGPRDLGS